MRLQMRVTDAGAVKFATPFHTIEVFAGLGRDAEIVRNVGPKDWRIRRRVMRRQRHNRYGAALLAALLCLLVVAMILGAMLSSLSIELRGTQTRHKQLQATWLARSAVARAKAQLAANPAYQGESWQVPRHRGRAFSAQTGGFEQNGGHSHHSNHTRKRTSTDCGRRPVSSWLRASRTMSANLPWPRVHGLDYASGTN